MSYAWATSVIENLNTSTTGLFPQRGFEEYQIVPMWVALAIIWVFGFFGNFGNIIVLSRMKQTPLNVFIMGLSCTDILSAIASPFDVKSILSFNKDYQFNRLVCKTVYPTLDVTSAVTIQYVLALSIWRFYAIHRPRNAAAFMTLKRARQVVICSWLIWIAALVPIPALFLDLRSSLLTGKRTCYFKPSVRTLVMIFSILDAVVANMIPITLIVVLCIATALSLLKRKREREELSHNSDFRKDEKSALVQLALIMASFLIGYLPKFIYQLTFLVGFHDYYPLNKLKLVSRGILNLTEAINPIIYNIGSSAIAKETKKSLRLVLCRCQPAEGEQDQQQQTGISNPISTRQTTI